MINRTARRLVVAATSAAVAGTALVGATATAANAAEATNAYTCTLPAGLGSGDFDVTVAGGLPPQFWAGAFVPAALANGLAVDVTATVPPEFAATLNGFGIKEAKSDDFALALGSTDVKAPVAGPFKQTDAGTIWDATGTVSPFTTPKPGTYDVKVPQAFDITVSVNGSELDVPCTLAEGEEAGSLGQITLLQQSVKAFTAKGATVKKGKQATVKVTKIEGDGGLVSGGKVTAFKGNKKVGTSKVVKNGKTTIKIAKLPVGKNKLTLKYGNNPSVKAATAKVTVTVKK